MTNAPLMERNHYVEQMRNWLDRQSHLPNDFDDRVLHRFIHSCNYDLEKTKLALESFVSIRGSTPEMMTNRDPESPEFKRFINIINIALYDLPNKQRLFVWQINDPGFDVYNYVSDAKLFALILDIYLLTEDLIEDGVVFILDTKYMNYKFMSTLNLSVCKKLLKYQLEAMPVKLNQIHIVNVPPIIDTVLGVMKPFMSKAIIDMIKLHAPSSDTLFDYLKREDVPADYGGTLPSLYDTGNKLLDAVPKIRENLLRNDLWMPTGKKDNDVSMDKGSFRTLNLD